MRVCPTCKAEINDYDSICEYCGTELPADEQYELAVKNAELILKESNSLLTESYKLKKYDLDILDRLSSPKSFLELHYSDSELAQKKITEINKNIRLLEEKISIYKRKNYKKSIRNTILISTILEITIFILCFLVFIFNPDDVEGFIVGIPGLIGLLIGLGLSADSSYIWGGALAGIFTGGLIGMLIFWLISNPLGQILLILGGTIGVILGIIFGIKKAKKTWL